MTVTVIELARRKIRLKPLIAIADREGFALHAAPEAIAAFLADARVRVRQATNEVDWLTALSDQRDYQVRHGLWPLSPCPCGRHELAGTDPTLPAEKRS